MYTTIQHEIRALRGLVDQFAAQMDTGAPYDRTELLARRMDFSRKFQAYLVTLDAASRHPVAGPAALASTRALRLLLCDYSTHLQYWTPREIDADWARYCRDVRTLQTGLRALFDVQDRDLVPLLRGVRTAA